MIKTENQIWKFLISELTTVLNNNLRTGWVVLRDYQPSIQGLLDKGIYIHSIEKRRIGTQGTTTEYDNLGNCYDADHWYEEILFRVSAFCKRNPDTETYETITSEDVLGEIMAYINSSTKVAKWKSEGYEVIKSTNMRLLDFETDSGLQEKMPQFDFLLCVEQKVLKKINKIDTINIETKRV